MGGRGTYAVGNNVAYTYETVGKIGDVKILERMDKSKSGALPEEAHASQAYIQLDKNGVFRRMRFYNEKHLPVLELDYHNERGISAHGEAVLHIHEYSQPGIEYRLPARKASAAEIEKYRIYLKGVY